LAFATLVGGRLAPPAAHENCFCVPATDQQLELFAKAN